MSRIGSHTLTATNTSADLTIFAYNNPLPQGLRGKFIWWMHTVPAVSAATCCAEVVLHDASHNIIWNSAKGQTSGSTQAEATTLASAAGLNGVNYPGVPIEDTDHFHIQWSARPSGDDNLPASDSGADVTSTLKVWIEEG